MKKKHKREQCTLTERLLITGEGVLVVTTQGYSITVFDNRIKKQKTKTKRTSTQTPNPLTDMKIAQNSISMFIK